jgi:hypothetical protein
MFGDLTLMRKQFFNEIEYQFDEIEYQPERDAYHNMKSSKL